MGEREYSAIEVRELVQKLFPHRKLVLSQFTFFQQAGVSRSTGSTFKRGRRCYRLVDILPIVAILALKEQGIPLKNIEAVPALLQDNLDRIFATTQRCRLSGFGSSVSLNFEGEGTINSAVESFLSDEADKNALFWSYDVSILASKLQSVESGDVEHSIAVAA